MQHTHGGRNSNKRFDMNIYDDLSFEKIRLIRDNTEILVFNNDVESAAKHLRRRVLQAGVLKALRTREQNPKRSDWLKAKRLRAASHRARYLKRKAASAARNSSR
jgi:ribosomal protein S21